MRPPQPGVPQAATDVTGIYRTRHQGLLQLRADGDFVLVISDGIGASQGSYTLAAGLLQVRTGKCGDELGEYRLQVTGEPVAGKALLHFEAVSDGCTERRTYLTIDPWVYANS